MLALAWGALAIPATPARGQDTEIDQCIEALERAHKDPTGVRCTFDRDGNFEGFSDAGDGFGSLMPVLVMAALLGWLVPFGLAWVFAAGNGESVGRALALTAVLGWVGLAIVYVGQRKVARAAADLVSPQ